MDNAVRALSEFLEKGISFSLDNGKFRCHAPKGALSVEVRDRIRELKPELIRLISAQAESAKGVIQPAKQRPATLPLSYAQERLWFLTQLGLGDQYHIPGAARVVGNLDKSALKRALNFIVARHESLRTSFRTENGVPSQVVDDVAHLHLEERDLSDTPLDELESRRDAVIREVTETAFDLECAPLMRAVLIRMNDDSQILALCMHHIISDGWSINILMRDIQRAYVAYAEGQEPELMSPQLQYADYAIWQREYLTADRLESELDQWDRYLEGYSDLALPTDFPRPKQLSGAGGHLDLIIEAADAEAIRKTCLDRRVTLFTALMLSVYVLLRKYTGQKDICLGMPVANRSDKQLEDIVGFFVNMLVVRIASDAATDDSIAQLLQHVQSELLAVQDRQSVPFEKVVERVQPKRDLSRSPVFQVAVNYVNTGANLRQGAAFGETTIQGMARDYNRSKFDLSFSFSDLADGGLAISLEFSKDLFSESTVSRMGGHLRKILKGICVDSYQPVDALDILDASERALVLDSWNDTAAPFPDDVCVHDLFEMQAGKSPDAAAVSFNGAALTYRELDAKSTQLALFLQQQGVGPDSLVGLCLERSLEMEIGILGILKAGGAYVPVEPGYPAARQQYMFADCTPALILTQSDLKGHVRDLAAVDGSRIIALDAEWERVSASSGELTRTVQPEHAAYVIYTSGSTGRPKGVLVSHRAICNRLVWMQETYQLGPDDRVLQKTPFGFDVSVWEFLWPVLTGARLVFAPPEVHKDPAGLAALISEAKITTLHFVPSMLQAFLAVDGVGALCSSVRRVICSGEALGRDVHDRCLATLDCELHNLYGPTEAAVDVTSWACRPGGTGSIPIGRPISNTQIYILDKLQRPVPVGVPGELYIAGTGLARGYVNRSELTASRFVENPFRPGTRMYRTGDLARWLEDGSISYLGRLDHQVKIRGFRIECGEIETVLAGHAGVEQAVVIAREVRGNLQLIAYYTSGSEVAEGPALREYLQARLPDYMVPAGLVSLETIPLSANGKVDRKALQQQEVGLVSSEAYVAPRTETEAQLVRIWESVLHSERIGVHDNFFELGGHSLLAVQIISRIQMEIGVDVPLSRMFETANIKALASTIESSGRVDVVPITSVERPEHIPLSYSQERLWFLAQLGFSDQYHMPGAAISEGAFDPAALQQAINYVVARHESLRTGFETRDGSAVQVIAPTANLPLRIEDLRDLAPAETEATTLDIIEKVTLAPFDLKTAPLMRVVLILQDESTRVLALCMHHIISDGWSIGILMRDIQRAYLALIDGDQPDMEPLPVQYADYAVWQRQVLTEAHLEHQLSQWQSYLAGYSDLDFPTDFARPKQLSGEGSHLNLGLTAKETNRFRQFCQERQITLFTLFLTSVYIVLRRYSGQNDFCLGIPVANRNHTEIEDLVGFFVNMLVVRIAPEDTARITVEGLLHEVQQNLVNIQDRQSVPFEKIVESVQPNRDLSRSPLFQVMVNYINTGDSTQDGVTFGSSTMQPLDLEYNRSKFDLTFSFTDEDDGGIGIQIGFSTDLYHETTMRRVANHFLALLRSLPDSPAAMLNELSLLTGAERTRILNSWNRTQAVFPLNACVHDLFESRVAEAPNRIAAVFGHESMSYKELDERSTRLAQYLQEQGVCPEVMVGICIERSFEMLIGILGILKAGGAYVPIDPAYPASRIEYILSDCGTKLLLTQSKLKNLLMPLVPDDRIQLLALDDDWPGPANPERSVVRDVLPDNLAYVIYTSGSTGRPKGVMIEHRSILNTLFYLQREYPVSESDSYLLKTNFVFDVSLSELMGWFIGEGRVVILRPGDEKSPEAIETCIEQNDVTHINFVPSMFHLFLDYVERQGPARLASLRYLMIAGEAFPKDMVRTATALFDERQFVENIYGPTEASVYASGYSCSKQPVTSVNTPIGRPIANTQLYILDPELNPVPIGVAGELHIGGIGLARGYLNKCELTEEKFVRSPFAPDERMYKTGDLAKWLPDGNVEYLGRLDHQVKIRGFRIECGEIETVLLSHEQIREVVVIARTLNGSTQLVAYYVPAVSGTQLEVAALRDHLASRVPEYMVPAAFVNVHEIPLNANGKADRSALAKVEVGLKSSSEFVETRTPAEANLAKIWRAVLGVDRVGINDNFFELGGHSLIALQLVSRIKEKFGVELPLSLLFEQSTIAEMAAELEGRSNGADAGNSALVPIQSSGRKSPVYFVHGIGGNSLSFVPLSKALGADRPLFAFEPPGLSDDTAPLETIEALAAHYIDHLPDDTGGGYILGGWSMGGLIALEMALQLREQGRKVRHLLLIDSYLHAHFTELTLRSDGNGSQLLNVPKQAQVFLMYLAEAYGIEVLQKLSSMATTVEASNDSLDGMIQHAKAKGLLEGMDVSMIKRSVRVREANQTALEAYSPASAYAGSAYYVYARNKQLGDALHTGSQEFSITRDRIFDNTISIWRRSVELPGHHILELESDHFAMMQDPSVAELAAFIETNLVSVSRNEAHGKSRRNGRKR